LTPETPHALYYYLGFFILSNVGILGTLFRGVWWVAKADARLEKLEKDLNNLYAIKRREQMRS
jgi:hypothetical protein